MRADVDAGAQFQLGAFALEQTIGDAGGVLRMHHADALFQGEGVGLIGEDGKAILKPEALEKGADGIGLRGTAEVVRGELVGLAIQAEGFFELVEHHGAGVGSGERGDQPAVKAPRVETGDSSGGIAAEAVGDKPFAIEFAGGLIDGDGALEPWRAEDVHISAWMA